ncbi:glycosyltransferase [Priestia megaterium]|uniref:glycosyltransferase n=1 Tax=Priestia megaterium TaxID=1404 RepID=UPI000BF61640|nr:glycosyltransferase [Priestia megaterium]PFI91796.1 glycosyl transferase [Priestia megaterium]PGR14195.1 glycosyl transferase [Priestia megaterium]
MKNEIFSDTSRRLAVIDTRFPWKQSGFRYWENIEIFRQKPDTLFFATDLYRDEFPAPVYNFQSFNTIAKKEGITDIYCVFLNLVSSLLGTCYLSDGTYMPGSNPRFNIKPFLKENDINIHTTLYPGGGLDPSTSTEFLHIAAQNCKTIFTNINEVLNVIPNSIYLPGLINTDFYSYAPKSKSKPIQLTFSAHRAERKGFPLLAQTFNQLDEHFHLNIIGDWQNDLHLITNKNYTFFGLLNPERIKLLYKESHVFIYCGTQDQFALDGFPTTAAADAMATGCVLVSTNPRDDRFILESKVDYLHVEADVNSITGTLFWIKENFKQAMEIGENGATKIKNYFDSRAIVKSKLSHIFQSTINNN